MTLGDTKDGVMRTWDPRARNERLDLKWTVLPYFGGPSRIGLSCSSPLGMLTVVINNTTFDELRGTGTAEQKHLAPP